MNRERLNFTKSQKVVVDYARRFWGHDDVVLTKRDIERLLDGEIIYFDDGEYTTSLSVEEEVE